VGLLELFLSAEIEIEIEIEIKRKALGFFVYATVFLLFQRSFSFFFSSFVSSLYTWIAIVVYGYEYIYIYSVAR